jgi:transposase
MLFNAHQLSPADAVPRQLLDIIGEIYAVEAEARHLGATSEQRLALRQERSRPLMDRLRDQLVSARAAALPKSVLGRGCAYALGQWARLEVFLKRGEIEVDNNWAENALRPVVLGRKNFLHIGSEWAGPRLAAIWSVYGTCQRLGINPRAYLRSILPRLAEWPIKRVAELSPLVWKP